MTARLVLLLASMLGVSYAVLLESLDHHMDPLMDNEPLYRAPRSVGAPPIADVVAQANWANTLSNWEDLWYFMEGRLNDYNDTLDGRTDRTYLRNALDKFQGKVAADIERLVFEESNNVDGTSAAAAGTYGNMLKDGLMCSATGALDALDRYTCEVMTDTSEPIDDVLFSLLKGEQHLYLAQANPARTTCEYQTAHDEWMGTLNWVYQDTIVNHAHEYVVDMVTRLAVLLDEKLNDRTQACQVVTDGKTKADADFSGLSAAEQVISQPKVDNLGTLLTQWSCQ